MAGKKKSKTNVAARQSAKNASKICKFCSNDIQVVMRVSPTGKKGIVRTCCE